MAPGRWLCLRQVSRRINRPLPLMYARIAIFASEAAGATALRANPVRFPASARLKFVSVLSSRPLQLPKELTRTRRELWYCVSVLRSASPCHCPWMGAPSGGAGV